jgi:hypothetical protein
MGHRVVSRERGSTIREENLMPTEEMTMESGAREDKRGLRGRSTEPKADAIPSVWSSGEARAVVDAEGP